MLRYTVPNIHDIDQRFTVVDLIKWSSPTHQHEKDHSKTPNVYNKNIFFIIIQFGYYMHSDWLRNHDKKFQVNSKINLKQ